MSNSPTITSTAIEAANINITPDGTVKVLDFGLAKADRLLVRRFQRLGDLLRDGQRVVNRIAPARDALREILGLDQFYHESLHSVGVLEAVDRGDVRMIQRGEDFRFARRRARRSESAARDDGRICDGDMTFSVVSRAR